MAGLNLFPIVHPSKERIESVLAVLDTEAIRGLISVRLPPGQILTAGDSCVGFRSLALQAGFTVSGRSRLQSGADGTRPWVGGATDAATGLADIPDGSIDVLMLRVQAGSQGEILSAVLPRLSSLSQSGVGMCQTVPDLSGMADPSEAALAAEAPSAGWGTAPWIDAFANAGFPHVQVVDSIVAPREPLILFSRSPLAITGEEEIEDFLRGEGREVLSCLFGAQAWAEGVIRECRVRVPLLQGRLARLERVVSAIRASRTYRILRRLNRWSWIEEEIAADLGVADLVGAWPPNGPA